MSPIAPEVRGRRGDRVGVEAGRVRHGARLPSLAFPMRTALRRWRRLVGMILGVGISLGLAMTMMAMIRASVELLVGDFHNSAANIYVHTEGGTMIPMLPGDGPGEIDHARNTLSRIRGLPGVQAAFGAITWPVEREYAERVRRSDEPTELIAAVGVDGEPTAIRDAVLMREGRWLRRSDEIVVGWKLAREKHLAIGDIVRLENRDFIVVGVGRLRGIGFGANGYAYMDARTLRQQAGLGDILNIVVVQTNEPSAAYARIPDIDSLTVVSPDDLTRQAEASLETALVAQGLFIGLTLGIAGLFVANMLGRSVATRRLEFATLRAIGMASRSIMLLVVTEALLVTVLASIVGIAFSLFLGWLTDTFMAPIYGIETLYVPSVSLFVNVVLLAVALGLAAGAVPAFRAIRVDPVEVLREA